jgi:peptide/nickel transport system substrate-binding protein
VAATAAPAKPAAASASSSTPKPAAAKPAGAMGSSLVGKLEGPEVMVDPARMPKAFKEAPQLAELVKQGVLPPVQQRIGQEPLVIKPVHEIGTYGGTWRRGFTGPGDKWNGYRAVSGPDRLLFWDYTGEQIVPNIARGYELQDDGRTMVVHLRRGMRWSDGQPFTADDFVFWFEDVYQNKDLVPTPSAWMAINGKQGKLEKVDATTIRLVFPEPYYLLPDALAGTTQLSGHAYMGNTGMGLFAPAHYLKQYLPKYSGQEKVDQLVKEAGFDSLVSLFKFKNDWALNPELPTIAPWKTVSPINTPNWTLERNPYSIWLDTDGNQLPYIDKVSMTLAENVEVLNLRAIAGEYDFQSRHIDMGKVPVYLENQEKGGYKLRLDPSNWGGDMIVKFNMSYDGDPEIVKWFNERDFRRALALGIDREQVREVFWLGTGTPSSVVPSDDNKYNPGPEYRTLWATFEPDKANQMLDALGLDKRDSEGYRLRTDGNGPLRLTTIVESGQHSNFVGAAEMIGQQWKKVGIHLEIQVLESALAEKRATANETQLYMHTGDGSDHLFTYPNHVFPSTPTTHGGVLYYRWYASAGSQGKEPPARLKEMMLMYRRAYGVPEQERIQLGKEIWKIVAEEVWTIGVVGLAAATSGVRIVKNGLRNAPERQYNGPDGMTPGASRPVTFFWARS